MMLKISKNKWTELFTRLSCERELYAPIEKSGQVQFEKWDENSKVRFDKLNTIKSAKDLFFPQSENLVAFKTKGKSISIIENRDESKPFVVFGVRGCDAASFEILDRVFLAEPVDTYYKTRRENGTVVTLACGEPEETCFCSVFGIDAVNPKGDVAAWIIDDVLYWKSITKKGHDLTEEIKTLLEEIDTEDEIKLQEYKEFVKSIFERLPLRDINLETFISNDVLMEKFNSTKWKELSQPCMGCGTCTFICPTCHCYDIRDFDTGHGIKRFRCWDSCMYSDFTKMAHGNPRNSQLERFRQRFMHKLVYFPENNNGVFACVGCGRCISKCPVSMNIVKVIKALEENEDE